MRVKRPYILPDGTEIPGHWYQNPERFVATEYGWRKMREWGYQSISWCYRSRIFGGQGSNHLGGEWHHKHGRGGGKRDDRFESMEWLCRAHHQETPILRRKHNVEEGPSPVVTAQSERV